MRGFCSQVSLLLIADSSIFGLVSPYVWILNASLVRLNPQPFYLPPRSLALFISLQLIVVVCSAHCLFEGGKVDSKSNHLHL